MKVLLQPTSSGTDVNNNTYTVLVCLYKNNESMRAPDNPNLSEFAVSRPLCAPGYTNQDKILDALIDFCMPNLMVICEGGWCRTAAVPKISKLRQICDFWWHM